MFFSDITTARKKITPYIKKTELLYANRLSEQVLTDVYLKLENLQFSGSFKVRGALHKLLTLTDEQRQCGVIAASAGNHAQGVAIGAKQLGIQAKIVMPKTAPLAKVNATKRFGAEVILAGDFYDEAYAHACELQKQTGMTFIHPFDDEAVIAGQGTIGLEMYEAQPDLEIVFIPIGGGGLAAGVGYALKTLNPNIRIIGVQSAHANSMQYSLQHGCVERICVARTIADGIAVATPGQHTFPLCQNYVDQVVTVTETQMAVAMLDLLENCNLLCEGAGAASVAAIQNYPELIEGKKVGAILSGGNIDINTFESVINTGLKALGRRSEIKLSLTDHPGELARLLDLIAEQEANILHIRQSRDRDNLTLYQMGVTLVFETLDQSHKERVLYALEQAGYLLCTLPTDAKLSLPSSY
ncbi:MAG: threonine ammonia-lyase [Culicoidibacterales bacterium]